jgi:hypothetical protein
MHSLRRDRRETTHYPFVFAVEQSEYVGEVGRLRFSTSGHVHNENRLTVGSPIGRLQNHMKPTQRSAEFIVHAIADFESNVLGY